MFTMETWILLTVWAVTAGYVTAGVLASLYQWLAAEPVSFRLLMSETMARSVLAVPLLAFAGPAVIARNAWRGRVVEGRAWGWIAASAAIVGTWSFLTGVIVLDGALALRALLA